MGRIAWRKIPIPQIIVYERSNFSEEKKVQGSNKYEDFKAIKNKIIQKIDPCLHFEQESRICVCVCECVCVCV